MNCKVCDNPIEKHELADMITCIDDSRVTEHYLDAVAFAQEKGYLEWRRSDGGFVVFKLKGEGEPIRTKLPVEVLYRHYLTKVKRKSSPSVLFEEASEVADDSA